MNNPSVKRPARKQAKRSEDQPEAHLAYGRSPAMAVLPAIRAFNALPIGSPERRMVIKHAHHLIDSYAIRVVDDADGTMRHLLVNSLSPRIT